MAAHVDEVLFAIPQVEFIYTVENDSDSQTYWEDATGRRHSIRTEPNSMVLIEAGRCLHGVTQLKLGMRTILKGMLTSCEAEQRLERFEDALDSTTSTISTRTSRRSKKRKA